MYPIGLFLWGSLTNIPSQGIISEGLSWPCLITGDVHLDHLLKGSICKVSSLQWY